MSRKGKRRQATADAKCNRKTAHSGTRNQQADRHKPVRKRKLTSWFQSQERKLRNRQLVRLLASFIPRFSPTKKGRCSYGANCPFVRAGKDDRPPSLTRQQPSDNKDANVIAKGKAGGNSLQVPSTKEKICAKGNLQRQKATGTPKSQSIGQLTT